MELPRIMLVTDRASCHDLPWAVEQALRGGIRLIQLREKDLPARELLALARTLRELTRRWDAMLLVNDRVDVALLSKADGVHLGEAALPVADARSLLPPNAVVTVAAHSLATAKEAEADGADAVVLGTIFPTDSKPGRAPAGLSFLREIVRSVQLPVFAIGGIDPDRAAMVLREGAYGVAVIRSVLAQPDPFQASLRLQQAVESIFAQEEGS